jgi:hypothetical protein
MKTNTHANDKEKLREAFKAVRKSGVTARLGINGCCRSCIWFRMTAVGTKPWDGKPVVWFYNGQGNQLRYDLGDNVTSHDEIYLNHNSGRYPAEIAASVEILRGNGLEVSWSGKDDDCIVVRFRNPLDRRARIKRGMAWSE